MLKLVCYSFPHCLSQAMCKKKRSVVRGKLSVDRLHRRCSGAAVCRNPTQESHVLLRGQCHDAEDRAVHPRGCQRLSEASVLHRRKGLCCGLCGSGDHRLCQRRRDAVQIHPLRVPHRRDLVHAGRPDRHEDRHQFQRPYRPGRIGEPEPRSAGGFLLRRGYGLHRGGPGHAGHQHLADDSPLRRRHHRSCPAGQHHRDERHRRLLHGSVCPCGRRHLHQGR